MDKAESQRLYVEKLTRESLGYMEQVHLLKGKIQSALAIIEGSAFGEYDGDLGDAVVILHLALNTEGED